MKRVIFFCIILAFSLVLLSGCAEERHVIDSDTAYYYLFELLDYVGETDDTDILLYITESRVFMNYIESQSGPDAAYDTATSLLSYIEETGDTDILLYILESRVCGDFIDDYCKENQYYIFDWAECSEHITGSYAYGFQDGYFAPRDVDPETFPSFGYDYDRLQSKYSKWMGW